MNIDIITLFPEFVEQVGQYGVTGRALHRGLLEVKTWNPRAHADDAHASVDDRPYGGGPGMVMQYQPLADTLAAVREARGSAARVIYLSPQGRPFDQAMAHALAVLPACVLICGRYEGVDERLLENEADLELSLGDYVLSGGELAAMVVIDALVRLLPGALGSEDSSGEDTFSAGLLEYPQYTRPADAGVPPVLLSGDHGAIRRWRLKQALGRTWLRRQELLDDTELTPEAEKLLQEFIAEQPAGGADETQHR
jgi:tRNA (guanine37-N1)-methyltransferase